MVLSTLIGVKGVNGSTEAIGWTLGIGTSISGTTISLMMILNFQLLKKKLQITILQILI